MEKLKEGHIKDGTDVGTTNSVLVAPKDSDTKVQEIANIGKQKSISID